MRPDPVPGRRLFWLALILPACAIAAVAGGLTEADVQRWMQTRLALHESQAAEPESGLRDELIAEAGYTGAAQFRAHGARIAEAGAALTRGSVTDPERQRQMQRLKDLRAAGLMEQGEFEAEMIELQSAASAAAPSRKDWAAVKPHLPRLQALDDYVSGRSETPPAL